MMLFAIFTFWLSCAAAGVVYPAAGADHQAHDTTSYDASVKQQNAVVQPVPNASEKGIAVDFTTVEKQDIADRLYNLTSSKAQEMVERADTNLEENEGIPTKSTLELHPRDPVDDYNAEHPFNRIPDWVYCYHPSEYPVTPTRHERMNILAALEAGLELRDDDIWNRPRFAGIRYPHIIAWTDFFSQTITHVRRLNLGHARGDPFMFPILSKSPNLYYSISPDSMLPFWASGFREYAVSLLGMVVSMRSWL